MKVLSILTILTLLSFMSQPDMLYDFTSSSMSDWRIVNDGVMGGLSKGNLQIDEEGHGIFSGSVSLENNGGFTSIRSEIEKENIDPKGKIVLRVKGDGKRYQLRLKHSSEDYYSYIQYFETENEWQEIELKIKDFYPSFRGRKLDMKNFHQDSIEEISILIANSRAEEFELTIDYLALK